MKHLSIKRLLSVGVILSTLLPLALHAMEETEEKTQISFEEKENTPWMTEDETTKLVESTKNLEETITTRNKTIKKALGGKRLKELGLWGVTGLFGAAAVKNPNKLTFGATGLLSLLSGFNHWYHKNSRNEKLEEIKSNQATFVNNAKNTFEVQVNGIPSLALNKTDDFTTTQNTKTKDILPTYMIIRNLSLRKMMKNENVFQEGSKIIGDRVTEGYEFMKTYGGLTDEDNLKTLIDNNKSKSDAAEFINTIMNQKD